MNDTIVFTINHWIRDIFIYLTLFLLKYTPTNFQFLVIKAFQWHMGDILFMRTNLWGNYMPLGLNSLSTIKLNIVCSNRFHETKDWAENRLWIYVSCQVKSLLRIVDKLPPKVKSTPTKHRSSFILFKLLSALTLCYMLRII